MCPLNCCFYCANIWLAMDATWSLLLLVQGTEDGLVVPGYFKATSNGKALICILKNELEKKAEKLKHMGLNVSAV